ncbi:MAG: flippase activity-associated protein Agl23 [Ilumatobacteraceae bacterium]
MAVAAVLWIRLGNLGDRPLHHDESLDAWFAWRLSTGRTYVYDPAYHGPLRIMLTAGLFKLVGAGDTAARCLAAASGVALVATPGMIRSSLGRVGWIAAAVALAVSPTLVYFSRFGREDLPYALAATVGSLALVEFLREPRAHLAVVGALGLACAAAIKESFAITVLVLVTYLVGLIAIEWRGLRMWRQIPTLRRFGEVGAEPWWWAATAFVTVFVLSYTVLFTDPGGVWRGIWDGPTYWLGQHEVGRGSQPWSYYGVLATAYEWPMLILAAIGTWGAVRRPDRVRLFLVWSAISQFVIYSWAGERFPWLIVHPMVPIAMLAGLGAECTWHWGRLRSVGHRWIAASVLAVAVVWSVGMSVVIAQVRPNDPRELVVAVQTTDDVRGVAAELDRASATGSILIDGSDGGGWPFGWYVRDLPVIGFELSSSTIPLGVSAVVVAEANVPMLGLPPDAGTPFDLRATWLPDYSNRSPGVWWSWFTQRTVWNPVQQVPFRLVLIDPVTGAVIPSR